jgi:hypothetical protein
MRWKLLRRRLSISAPRMSVRSQLPWPLRWALLALALGFSAAIALWAFEFGKGLAGLDQGSRDELSRLRAEVAELRDDRDKAQVIADTAESLLKTERVAQERLAAQLRLAEGDNLQLRADLAFFERLLPAAGASAGVASDGLSVRSFRVTRQAPDRLRYQLLVMQGGKPGQVFNGHMELTLVGLLEGKPWSMALPEGPRALQLRQYARLDGSVEHPDRAVVKTVQLRILDAGGGVRATQVVRL